MKHLLKPAIYLLFFVATVFKSLQLLPIHLK